MDGNSKPNVILQERDRRLLLELKSMGVVDRQQAGVIASFRSASRCSARLLRLTRAGYLQTSFIGTIHGGRRALYQLPRPRKRQALVVSPRSSLFLEHRLAINEVYVRFKYAPIPRAEASLRTWRWIRAPLSVTSPLIPDGYIELSTKEGVLAMFLEVDCGTEALSVWGKKIRNYLNLALSGEFEKKFERTRFRVLVIANEEERAESIRELIRSRTSKIFWVTTTKKIKDYGFWAPVWLRPGSSLSKSLIERTS